MWPEPLKRRAAQIGDDHANRAIVSGVCLTLDQAFGLKLVKARESVDCSVIV